VIGQSATANLQLIEQVESEF